MWAGIGQEALTWNTCFCFRAIAVPCGAGFHAPIPSLSSEIRPWRKWTEAGQEAGALQGNQEAPNELRAQLGQWPPPGHLPFCLSIIFSALLDPPSLPRGWRLGLQSALGVFKAYSLLQFTPDHAFLRCS